MSLRSIGLGAAAFAVTTAIATATLVAPPALAASPGDRADPTPAETATEQRYYGKVTARSGLLLREKPTRTSRVVGTAEYDSIVSIYCKNKGDKVNQNTIWYLLSDGKWAWVSSEYIHNIGPVPRWC